MSYTSELYTQRDASELGEHYIRHIHAMTVEGLHSKSDIAAELAWRDQQIELLTAQLDALRADAERYRWLRATTNWVTSNGERVDVRNNPGLWDTAIDAAKKGKT